MVQVMNCTACKKTKSCVDAHAHKNVRLHTMIKQRLLQNVILGAPPSVKFQIDVHQKQYRALEFCWAYFGRSKTVLASVLVHGALQIANAHLICIEKTALANKVFFGCA